MLREAINNITIEGVLAEVNLDYTSYVNKDGNPTDAIRGEIVVRVDHEVGGEHRTEDVTVSCFAPKKTAKNGDNPSFQSWDSIKKNGISIAACGNDEEASRIAIRPGKNPNGKITMNEYWSQSGTLVRFPRITASFVNIVQKSSCNPKAEGTVEMVVDNMGYETNRNGEETGRLLIRGIVPKYGGKVDIIDFICESNNVIDIVANNWERGNTVRANVRLNFSQRTETVTKEVDFGDPIEETKTIRVSEVIIFGGMKDPLDNENAFDIAEINKAAADHREAINALKDKKKNKPAPGPAKIGSFDNLGF